MYQGDILKRYGLDRVEEHNPDFVAIVRAKAVEMAKKHGQITSDDLRLWANNNNIYPLHSNAWGAIFRSGWRRVGFTKSQIPSNHSRIISIWELK